MIQCFNFIVSVVALKRLVLCLATPIRGATSILPALTRFQNNGGRNGGMIGEWRCRSGCNESCFVTGHVL